MGKKKILGICAVEGCGKAIDSLGWCTLHYQRHYKHGTTDRIGRLGKTKHPNLQVWWDRYGYGSLPPEWLDFWQFVKEVGDRPSKDHYLCKIDRSKPYSKDNFKWIEHVKRQPEEDEISWRKRKWQQRLKLKPSLKEYGKVFRELLANTGLSLDEYSKIYLEKFTEQNQLCAICYSPETGISHRNKKLLRLSLDHCHKSKKIRGLLCRKCNQALGLWEETPTYMVAAINYLENYLKNPTGIFYNHRNKINYLHKSINLTHSICAVCKNKETRKTLSGSYQRLSVDHDHTTMQIRGLVCARCNTGLGRIRDSVPFLQNMIQYLKKYS